MAGGGRGKCGKQSGLGFGGVAWEEPAGLRINSVRLKHVLRHVARYCLNRHPVPPPPPSESLPSRAIPSGHPVVRMKKLGIGEKASRLQRSNTIKASLRHSPSDSSGRFVENL